MWGLIKDPKLLFKLKWFITFGSNIFENADVIFYWGGVEYAYKPSSLLKHNEKR